MVNQVIMLLLAMIFCHIVDDYYLQGWLASAKQKKYWQDNAPDAMYKNDYIMALIMHSCSWAFMIMLPLLLSTRGYLGWFYIAYPINAAIHCVVDDLKANKKKINLIQDQLIHLAQIVITLAIFAFAR